MKTFIPLNGYEVHIMSEETFTFERIVPVVGAFVSSGKDIEADDAIEYLCTDGYARWPSSFCADFGLALRLPDGRFYFEGLERSEAECFEYLVKDLIANSDEFISGLLERTSSALEGATNTDALDALMGELHNKRTGQDSPSKLTKVECFRLDQCLKKLGY